MTKYITQAINSGEQTMDNKKFEKLIDLIINENEEQARELFHDIVIEKSREIYESIMDEEMSGQGTGGQVGDLLDEISAEETGEMSEDDELAGMGDETGDDFADDLGMDSDETIDLDANELGDAEAGEGEVEDAVVRIEDKLDQLMAEFEQIMGGDEEGAELGGDDEGAELDAGDDEGAELGGDEEGAEDAPDEMMEAVQLKSVPGLYGSKIGGDNGVQTKSPGLQNSGQKGMGSNPVKFSGQAESVPTGPKGPSNYGNKGETQVKGAGSFKNAPAQKTQDLEKAPAPTKSQATGVNTKSPVSESRKVVKKLVK